MIRATQIHAKLSEVLSPDQISHWYSDLYVKVTPESKEIVKQYEFRQAVSTFLDQITHTPWYEIPFAYDPNVRRDNK